MDPNLCGRSKLRNTASCDKKITCITRIYTLSRMLRAGLRPRSDAGGVDLFAAPPQPFQPGGIHA